MAVFFDGEDECFHFGLGDFIEVGLDPGGELCEGLDVLEQARKADLFFLAVENSLAQFTVAQEFED